MLVLFARSGRILRLECGDAVRTLLMSGIGGREAFVLTTRGRRTPASKRLGCEAKVCAPFARMATSCMVVQCLEGCIKKLLKRLRKWLNVGA